jgi:hypothetical protein
VLNGTVRHTLGELAEEEMISSTIVLKPFEEYVVGNTTDGRLVQIFEFDSFRTNET